MFRAVELHGSKAYLLAMGLSPVVVVDLESFPWWPRSRSHGK
jgi:hypothetical protein